MTHFLALWAQVRMHRWAIQTVLHSETLKLVCPVGSSDCSVPSLPYRWHHLMQSSGKNNGQTIIQPLKQVRSSLWGRLGLFREMLQDDPAQEKVHFEPGARSFIFLSPARSCSLSNGMACIHVSTLREMATAPHIGFLLSSPFQQGSMAENVQPGRIHHRQRWNQT